MTMIYLCPYLLQGGKQIPRSFYDSQLIYYGLLSPQH